MKHILFLLALMMPLCSIAKNYTYEIAPEKGKDFSPVLNELISKIKKETSSLDRITIKFSEGKYTFLSELAEKKDYSIAGHDLEDQRPVAMDFSSINNLTVDGSGAEFLFDGRILPIAAVGCKNLTLKNFSIDFPNPQILQMDIVKNNGNDGMIYYLYPWINCDIEKQSGKLINKGRGWESTPISGTVFDHYTKNIIYNISDISINTLGSDSIDNHIIESPNWVDNKLKTGMTIVSRGDKKYAPGIYLANNKDTFIESITIHYAEGTGIVAQYCENISLQKFQCSLRGKSDQRYFTTYSWATLFSDCKGKIVSTNGVYENMLDGAIDVHGTYLKITSIGPDRKEITAKYANESDYVTGWGKINDSICLISSGIIHKSSIESITQNKEVKITISDPVPSKISIDDNLKIENITQTPEVEFTGNVIKNNRASGCHISTPRKVLIKDNLFNHVSGSAIFFGTNSKKEYESGTCRNVIITKNRFIDVLTSFFQSTYAIITISAERADLYHSAFTIEDNYFETFDRPIVYAESVENLTFRKNMIYGDTRFKPYNENTYTFNLKKVKKYDIEENTYSGYTFNKDRDIRTE